MNEKPEHTTFDLEKLADQEVYKEYPSTTHNWYDKQREGFFNGFIKGHRHAFQQTASLQKQVEELESEVERIKKILRDMLEVDKEYRSRKVDMPMWVKSKIELALNPQDNQKEK